MELEQNFIDFKKHLENQKNERIIFSGPFGIGKTTFLTKYFGQEQDYAVIKLSPVNYSVSSNEDIFQIIKHDILFYILGLNIQFEKYNFSRLETLAMYLPGKVEGLFTSMLSFVPKTGNLLIDNIGLVYSLLKEYEKFHGQSKTKNQEKEIITFLENFTQKTGSIYEEDAITLLIQDLIDTLSSQGKKVVLMIDDLDRLDPEHIFRILNIFSSHYHSYDEKHKFNFEKVILVCDIKNIKAVFKHKYGEDADFMGYMDKFFSIDIFHFDNIFSLKQWLTKMTNVGSLNTTPFLAKADTNFIYELTNYFINNKKINFRNILKLDYDALVRNYDDIYNKLENKSICTLHLTKVGYILRILFGDISNLLERISEIQNLHKAKDDKSIFQNDEQILEFYSLYIFPVLTYRMHRFKERTIDFNLPNTTNVVGLSIIEETRYGYISAKINSPFPIARNLFWADFHLAINILDELDAL